MNYLNDPNISYKAKGIMTIILNEGYENADKMLSYSKDGRASYVAGMNELKKHGYVELKQVNNGQGYITWVLNVLKK